MLATEHEQIAQQFLLDADREFEAGDIFQASEKLWGAASHVVIAEMHRRGIKQSGHKAMVNAVEKFAEEYEDPLLTEYFARAEALHANFYHGFMEADDVLRYRSRVHRFVDRMSELSD